MLDDPRPGGTLSPQEQLAKDYAGGYGTGTTSNVGTGGQVYMGDTPQVTQNVGGRDSVLTGSYGQNNMARLPLMVSKSNAYQFLNGLNGKQLADFQSKMVYAGLIKDNDGIMEMQAQWKKLVDSSYNLTRAGNKVSPMDVLDSYLGKGPLGGKGGLSGPSSAALWQTQYRGGRKFLVNTQTGEVKYQGPRFETTYNKSIDLTDPTTAKAIATSVFQQLMHRDPGKGELAGYGSALHAAESQSPTVTNTTTEYDPNTGEAIGQSSSQQGGFGADAKQYLAQQRVKGTKEYASTQAATTYMNALESAIFNNPFGSI